MILPHFLGIDPDLQRPALAVVRGSDVVYVACFKTSKTTRQQAVSEVAREAMHWMDITCDELAIAGYSRSQLRRIVCEAQEIYAGKTKNPQDICLLAAAAGAVFCAARSRWPDAAGDFALPKDWKKGVPKKIHQARVLKRLGIEYDMVGSKSTGYCIPKWNGKEPVGADRVNPSDWKHIVDAIGLACYARDLE